MLTLFGHTDVMRVSITDVLLPHTPAVAITDKKLKSMSKTYHAIPNEHKWYYPDELESLSDGDRPVPIAESKTQGPKKKESWKLE